MKISVYSILFLFLFGCTSSLFAGKAELHYVIRVIDGDTIELSCGERVRLLCIDTPERSDYYYKESTEYLKKLVLGKEVWFVPDITDRDYYGRLLRYIYLKDGRFVNELIVRNGYGKPFEFEPDTKLCPIIKYGMNKK